MQSRVLKIDPRDNVLIALTDLRKGDAVDFSGTNYELVSEVPAKHKFVTADLAQGDRVIMYGVVVGKATEPLRRGQALTTRNLRHETSEVEEKAPDFHWTAPDVSDGGNACFRVSCVRMARWERETIGSSFRWSSARTATSPH